MTPRTGRNPAGRGGDSSGACVGAADAAAHDSQRGCPTMLRPGGTVASVLPTSSRAASLGCGEFGVEGFREMDTARQRLFRFDDERAAYRAASAIRDLNDSAVWDVKVVV